MANRYRRYSFEIHATAFPIESENGRKPRPCGLGGLAARFPRSLRSLGPVLAASAVVHTVAPFSPTRSICSIGRFQRFTNPRWVGLKGAASVAASSRGANRRSNGPRDRISLAIAATSKAVGAADRPGYANAADASTTARRARSAARLWSVARGAFLPLSEPRPTLQSVLQYLAHRTERLTCEYQLPQSGRGSPAPVPRPASAQGARGKSPHRPGGRPGANPERETAGSGTATTRRHPTDAVCEPHATEVPDTRDRSSTGELTHRGRAAAKPPRVSCRLRRHADGDGSMERRILAGASPIRKVARKPPLGAGSDA